MSQNICDVTGKMIYISGQKYTWSDFKYPAMMAKMYFYMYFLYTILTVFGMIKLTINVCQT